MVKNIWDSSVEVEESNYYWKEKPIVKKQLSIWSLVELKKIISEINNTELLCKKNPRISKAILFNFFSQICKKASNFS